MKVRNTFAIFLVSGFWHGANWTFIIWGALNAIYFLPLLLTNNNRNNLGVVAEGKLFPSLRELFAMLTTFSLTVFAWIFFRAENLSHAFSYIRGVFSMSFFESFQIIRSLNDLFDLVTTITLVITLLILEWLTRNYKHPMEYFYKNKINNIFRYFVYFLIILTIILFGNFIDNQQFVYFQF